MPYLVDGYNLARVAGFRRRSDREVDDVVNFLSRFARLKKTRITVVFDGFPPQARFNEPLTHDFGAVKIIFSGRKRNADTALREMMATVANKRAWSVVSTDHAVFGYARANGMKAIRSEAFLKEAETLMRAEVKEKADVSKDEVDYWLKVFERKD